MKNLLKPNTNFSLAKLKTFLNTFYKLRYSYVVKKVDLHKIETSPFIISVTNDSDQIVENVEILNAFKNQDSPSQDGNIIKKYELDIISYNQFLGWIAAGNGFAVKKTVLQSVCENMFNSEQQVQTQISFTFKDPHGNKVVRPFIPLIDIYQFQKNITSISYFYFVNGLTQLEVAKVYPKTTLKVFLYPIAKYGVEGYSDAYIWTFKYWKSLLTRNYIKK